MSTRRLEDGPWRETLVGLHEPAWWTGVRIGGAGQFRVRLLKIHDQPAFPDAPEECSWIQTGSSWRPFPWAIPAAMASHMGMTIEVEAVQSNPEPVSMRIAFHEMRSMPTRDRYLFVRDDGAIAHMWNGRQRTWGCPTEGDQPLWNSLHIPIPTMARLLSNRPWPDNRIFCIHAWDERCPMD